MLMKPLWWAPALLPFWKQRNNRFGKIKEFDQGQVVGPGYDLQNFIYLFIIYFYLGQDTPWCWVLFTELFGLLADDSPGPSLYPGPSTGCQFQSTSLPMACKESWAFSLPMLWERNVQGGRCVDIALRGPGIERWHHMRDSRKLPSQHHAC